MGENFAAALRKSRAALLWLEAMTQRNAEKEDGGHRFGSLVTERNGGIEGD